MKEKNYFCWLSQRVKNTRGATYAQHTRYLCAMLLVLFMGIGQMWAADPDYAVGATAQASSSFLGKDNATGITLSSSANFSSGAVQLGNTPSAYDQHYFEVLSSDAEIEKVSFLISGNGSNKSIQAPVFAWEETATSNTADTYVLLDAVTVTANSYAAAKWFEYDLSGASVKCARIYRTTKNISSTDPAYTGSSTALGSGQTIKIYGVKVWLKPTTIPAVEGAYSVTATSGSDAARGTVSAAASKADEGDEVVITASPADGYRVASWAVSGTGASIDPSGNSHSNTTTLTVGSADATVTVTFEAIPTHSVTAATEDALKGSAVAAAVSVAEGATTTITATAVTGYVFDHWTVSGTDAALNDVNANPVTLTMGTADAIVKAYFAEKTCPTSGVLFSADVKDTEKSYSTGTTKITSEEAEISGGKMYAVSEQSSDKKLIAKQSSIGYFCMTNDNTRFKIELECALTAGDRITIDGIGGDAGSGKGNKGVWISTETSKPASEPAAVGRSATGSKVSPILSYDVTNEDEYVGKSTIYVYRAVASSTYFDNVTITRPYNISFASAKGTAPSATKGFEVTLEQITGVENFVHTGWTADKAVKVGNEDKAAGTTLAVDATVTVSADVTFTAVWEEEIAAVDPEQTFANGTYTIGGAALDLSSLFTSNNTVGTVTYSVKTAGETGAAIDGVNFTATAAGEAVVTASQAASNGFNAKSIDATITVSAPVEVDGIKMVEEGALTGNFRTSQSLTPLSGDSKYTIAGLDYTKYIKFGSSVSSWSAVAGPSNKYLAFTPTKEKTNFYFYVHNNANSASYINLYLVEEGNTTPSKVQVAVAANENALKEYELNITKNTEVYITAESNNVYFCQVVAVESGNALKQAPEVGYVMNLNKGRLSTASGVATTLEGLTFYLGSGYSIASGSNISIGTKGTHYVSFTIPAGQTRQLQLTTSNTAKYTVSKTLGDDENQITPVSGTAKNFNLTAGTWYINPQGSNVNITNIAFAATPDPLTVTFKDGESTLSEQALFSGDKAVALDPAPTKEGYRFVEWRLSGSAYDFDAEVTKNIQLDAAWQKVWTVTFDADGGSDVEAAIVDDNTAVAEPTAPEKAGHNFVKWQKEGADYDFASLVKSNITLKAVWAEKEDDPSLKALAYDGNAIDLESGVDNEGVLTFTYELPYKGEYVDGKLVPEAAAASATLGSISFAGNKASFRVTSHDGPYKDYAVVFTNAAKDMLCLVWADMTGDNALTLDEDKSALDIEVEAKGGVKKESTPSEYMGYTGYKFNTSGAYVALKDGNFKAGDRVDVFVVSKINAVIPVFKAADGLSTSRVEENTTTMALGLNSVSLTSDATSLYLTRKGDFNGWNPHIAYVAVYRACPVPVVETISFNGVAGVVGDASITAEIPYSTNLATMSVEVSFLSNDPASTIGVLTSNEGAWKEGENTYVVTDKDGDSKTYTITLSRAEVSHDATLRELTVEGYNIDFDAEELNYSVQLPYGSKIGDLPEVTYTLNHSGATAGKTNATALPGVTTIIVTAEDKTTEKTYKVNFSVNRTPSVAIFDGRTMTEAVVSKEADATGLSWTSEGASSSSSSNSATINGREYTRSVKIFGSATNNSNRYLKITVPDGYLAKFYIAGSTNSSSGEATLFIAKGESTGDPANAITSLTASVNSPTWTQSALQLPGDYYFCTDGSTRLYELSVQLYPIDYSRATTEGRYGTICLPNGGLMAGATLYEVAYYDEAQSKIFFDEIINGTMVAGRPYIFQPKEGADKLAVTYTDALGVTAGSFNGLVGFIGADEDAAKEVPVGSYILNNNQYRLVEHAGSAFIQSNRAYINLGSITTTPTAPRNGRRRVSMGVQGAQVATGIGNVQGDEVQSSKLLINGQLFILRGEKMYDVSGRLVK